MREIKFRGKATCNVEDKCEKGDWIYGNLITNNGTPYIVGQIVESDVDYIAHEFWVPVEPESVGQSTDLRDKNGQEIYEGDIFKNDANKLYQYPLVIEWHKSLFCFVLSCKRGRCIHPSILLSQYNYFGDIEVIGNTQENPELTQE